MQDQKFLYNGLMIAFGHTAMGASIGLITYQLFPNQPVEGLLISGAAGVISHYVSDFIPHGHFFTGKEYSKKVMGAIFYDLLLSIVIFAGLAYLKWDFSAVFWYILFGIGGAQLPDVINGLVIIKKLPQTGLSGLNYQFHKIIHWHGEGKNALLFSSRDIWQLLVVLIALFLLIKA